MKLTVFTDYSLRVLIYLAIEPNRRVTIAEIAHAFRISENHLVKVVHFLGRGGWLANQRGRGGGMFLARTPAGISVGAIVRQAERSDHPAKCFGDMKEHCAIDRLCSLRGIFGDAVSAFYAVLDRYTLEDLVRNKESLHQVLFPIRRTRMMSAATIRKLRS